MPFLPKALTSLVSDDPTLARVSANVRQAVQPTLDFLNTYFTQGSDGSLRLLRNAVAQGSFTAQGAFTALQQIVANAGAKIVGDFSVINGNVYIQSRTGNGVVIQPPLVGPAFYITNPAGNQAVFLVYGDGGMSSVGQIGGANVVSGAGFVGELDCGNFWHTSAAANTMYATSKACVNAANGSLGGTPFIYKFPRAGSIVGYSLNNAGPITNGQNYISYYRNGSQIVNFGVGVGGNNATFWGTHGKGQFAFAAGDTLTTAVGITVAGNYQASLLLDIEMSA